MRKQYAPALKAPIVLAMLQDTRPVTQMAAPSGIAPPRLLRWRKGFLHPLPAVFADLATAYAAQTQEAKREDLYAQLGKLTTQLAGSTKSGLAPDL